MFSSVTELLILALGWSRKYFLTFSTLFSTEKLEALPGGAVW